MIDWDLHDRRMPQTLANIAVVCDPGRVSVLLTLRHSGLKGREIAEVSVASYVEAAPWLSAMLRVPTRTETNSSARLDGKGGLELVLVCTRAPTGEEMAAVQEGEDFRLVVPVTATDSSERRRKVEFHVAQIRLQTFDRPEPVITSRYPDIAEVSRRAALDDSEIVLWEVSAAMPSGALEYAGPHAMVAIDATVGPAQSSGGVKANAVMRRGEFSWPADLSRKDALLAGETLHYACSVPAAEIMEAAGSHGSVELRLEWSVAVQLSDREATPTKGARTIAIRVSRDEILALRIGDATAVPKMRPGLPEAPTSLDVEFAIPEPDAAAIHPGPDLTFDIVMLERGWEAVELFASVEPEGFRASEAWLASRSPILAQEYPDERLRATVPLSALVEGLAPGASKEHLALHFVFVARRDGERVTGAVSAAAVLREKAARYLACIDYGASATAVWFGGFRRDTDSDLVPLGEFVHSVAGPHVEYDPNAPGRNMLSPSIVGLGSDAHLRSRRDPLSLGDLTAIGAGDDCVARRLEMLGRTYDVSTPAERDADPATTIPDLKRRLLNSKARIAGTVAELRNGKLRKVGQLDLADLTRDAFRELGSWAVPNALRLGQNAGRAATDDHTLYEHWLDCEAGDIQIVVTHPSGVSAENRAIYREAGRAFAEEFAAMGEPGAAKEPKLVPEALAAAYFGITKRPKAAADHEVFACVDIGASTVDASLVQVSRTLAGAIENWKVLAHFGATVGGANLDDALLSLCARRLRMLFPHAGAVLDDLALLPRHVDDSSIRRVLAGEIQKAKRRLSNRLFERAGPSGPYGWERDGPGSAFRVDLRGIVTGREPGQPIRVRNEAVEGTDGSVRLRVDDLESGGQEIALEIDRALLDGHLPLGSADRDDPRTVSRLLGRAVPAMLIREAERLGVAAPEWVVTGRGSLWPSIYDGITRTVAAMTRGRSVPHRPFSADDMKNAIVHGARSLVSTTDLELTDGSIHPYALVQYEAGDEGIGQIDYLGTEGSASGSRRFPYRANCWLSRVLPGLGDPGSAETITRNEIMRLFAAFGQRVTVDECLVRRVGIAGARQQEVEIAWEQSGSSILFSVGDIRVPVRPNRLAGS